MYRTDILVKKLTEFIIPNYNLYRKKGVIIELVDNYLSIRFKNKIFKINILEINNNIVWEINYKNIIITKNINISFTEIIELIVLKNKKDTRII